jgi:hypothetical protein
MVGVVDPRSFGNFANITSELCCLMSRTRSLGRMLTNQSFRRMASSTPSPLSLPRSAVFSLPLAAKCLTLSFSSSNGHIGSATTRSGFPSRLRPSCEYRHVVKSKCIVWLSCSPSRAIGIAGAIGAKVVSIQASDTLVHGVGGDSSRQALDSNTMLIHTGTEWNQLVAVLVGE